MCHVRLATCPVEWWSGSGMAFSMKMLLRGHTAMGLSARGVGVAGVRLRQLSTRPVNAAQQQQQQQQQRATSAASTSTASAEYARV